MSFLTTICRTLGGSLIAGAGVLVLIGPAAAADLVAHRAVYEMRLSTSKRSSGVVDVRGTMILETVDACEWWETKQRIQLTFLRTDSDEFTTDSTFASLESKDGSTLQFSVRNAQNGELEDELRGVADLLADGTGKARFTQPEEREFPLPQGTIFPVRHLSQLIDDARAGETVKSYSLFDGARLDGAFKVNAVIAPSPRRQLSPAPRGDLALLRNQQAWSVRLAFYAANDQEGQPEYEVAMDLQANGVARSMVLDYGDLAINARLQRIEALPGPRC
ncbi:MAG: cell envelope integrity EipB family protein [Alphaproteobacteria bacterium]|nr:cell envelope integrity EipB family protein [Alphaproteobacteria bacterium]MCW5739929.1 cell envelope integrity EipB family protein [Alphaproteobacteria bacterium]